jgi:hypothetical protein
MRLVYRRVFEGTYIRRLRATIRMPIDEWKYWFETQPRDEFLKVVFEKARTWPVGDGVEVPKSSLNSEWANPVRIGNGNQYLVYVYQLALTTRIDEYEKAR